MKGNGVRNHNKITRGWLPTSVARRCSALSVSISPLTSTPIIFSTWRRWSSFATLALYSLYSPMFGAFSCLASMSTASGGHCSALGCEDSALRCLVTTMSARDQPSTCEATTRDSCSRSSTTVQMRSEFTACTASSTLSAKADQVNEGPGIPRLNTVWLAYRIAIVRGGAVVSSPWYWKCCPPPTTTGGIARL